MEMQDLKLTERQKQCLLLIVESPKSLKDCAMELGVSQKSLDLLLTRVERQYPGFRQRLKTMRRITVSDGYHSMPKEKPVGDLNGIDEDLHPSIFHPYSQGEIENDDCGRPRKSDMFRSLGGSIVEKF